MSSYADGPVPAGTRRRTGVWGQIYGAQGNLAAKDGTSGLDASTGGFAGGVDEAVDAWRVGLMLQAGTTHTEVAALDSSSDSTDYGLGLYGGREWAGTRLSLGAAYTRHDIDASRRVAFDGFSDRLTADYGADTLQAFGKLSHAFDFGPASLTPYASLAHVRLATDGFTESGGAAALSSEANVLSATLTSVGLGFDRRFRVGETMMLTASGSAGWRHAFGDAPSATHTLAGGTEFTVVGTQPDHDVAVLGAGLNLDISALSAINLSYDGQIGSQNQTHAINASYDARF